MPPLGAVATTETATLVAAHPFVPASTQNDPSAPRVLSEWLDAGYGDVSEQAGEPVIPLTAPGVVAPPPGAAPKLLVRFVHLSDTQLADDESPNRAVLFDQPGPTAGAFRPQEGLECRILNAAVRTINALHRATPIDFVLTGGDNADSAQRNEEEWFMAIMNGSPLVKCDSGAPNDVVPGPFNDGKDAFGSEGLLMPWRWVNGNHDVLVQGNFAVTEGARTQATGTSAPTGTRDYSKPGAPPFTGPVVADSNRLPLYRTELMSLVAGDGDGHGIGPAQITSGKATYSFDVAGTALRFVVIDTCDEAGDDQGIVHQSDIDTVIKPLLDKAQSDGKTVVLASHHSTSDIDDGSAFVGTPQPDALTPDQWVAFLTGYPNVAFYMVGHTHLNQVRFIGQPGAGFWQVMSSAVADYPNQVRLVEIWDDDNGWLRMRTVMVNYSVDGDAVAAQGRAQGFADAVASWAKDGYGDATDRNVELFIPKALP